MPQINDFSWMGLNTFFIFFLLIFFFKLFYIFDKFFFLSCTKMIQNLEFLI